MKYYVLSTTEGCATNLLENSSYRQDFENEGYASASSINDADIILVNTCGYNQDMENKATDKIADLRLKYPHKRVVLAGCLPKINPRLVKKKFSELEVKSLPINQNESLSHKFDQEDFSRLSSKHRLVLALRPYYFKIQEILGVKFSTLHNIFKSVVVNEEFYLITVSTGCLGKCTFCAIKRAKGSLKSRPLQVIMSEFEAGLNLGKRKFWLLGDDIGCWGQDLKLSIVDLLAEFTKRSEDFELVINYLDPQFLVLYRDRLTTIFRDRRIIGLNAPIQSGSDRILKDMARMYQIKPVYRAIEALKKNNPALALKTNIIVGFPGESWGDFFESMRSVLKFDAILALKYTPRPQTPAASYLRQISEPIKNIRMVLINFIILLRHLYVAGSSVLKSEKI